MRRFAIFLPLLSAAPAFAQPADIVVTGSGLMGTSGDRSDAVVEIDRERIVSTASDRLEDVLADVAGLQSFRRSDSRSANPTSQGLTLRGIGGNASSRALLILDGVPQTDPFAGWVAFPAYAPGTLGAIRVVRGGGAGLWGPGALSGVIEMESATPDQLHTLSAGLALGSRDSIDAQLATTIRRDNGFITLSGTYMRGDGFAPIVAHDRGPVDRAAPYEQANLSARAVFDMGGGVELQGTVRGFTDRRDRGLPFTDIGSEGADASLRIVGRGAWSWSALAYVQARRFTSRFAAVDAARTAANATLDQYDVPGTGLGGRIEIAPPAGDTLSIRFGGDMRQTRGATHELFTYVAGSPTRRREAGGRTLTAGAFADARFDFGTIGLDVNARIDGWWIDEGRLIEVPLAGGPAINDLRFPKRDGVEPTGRIGLSWRPVSTVTLRAAAYRGWRLPTLNELYRPFRVGADATAANAALRPERLRGAEIGADLRDPSGLFLSVTGFINRVDDAIANVTLAQGPGVFPGVGFVSAAGFYRQRDNLDALEARGIELEAGLVRGRIEARLSYAHTDVTVQGDGTAAALDGLRPSQTPSHQASATLLWRPADGARLALTGRYVSSQFEDDQNNRILGDAFTLDATAALPLDRRVTIEARIENAFDASVDAGFSGAAQERAHPRTGWIVARITL